MKEVPSDDEDEDTDEDDDVPVPTASVGASLKKKALSQHKVRTSVADRTLDSMFPLAPSSTPVADTSNVGERSPSGREREISESICHLSSVHGLREQVVKEKHQREWVFVCPCAYAREHLERSDACCTQSCPRSWKSIYSSALWT